MIPDQTIAVTLEALLEGLKGINDIREKRKRIEAHYKSVHEQRKIAEKFLSKTVNELKTLHKQEDQHSSEVHNPVFASASWVIKRQHSTEDSLYLAEKIQEVADRVMKANERLQKLIEEEKKALAALNEYQLEGTHCIIS